MTGFCAATSHLAACASACRGRDVDQFGDTQPLRCLDRILLQLAIGDDQHGLARCSRCHHAGAHEAFRIVLKRCGGVVPFDEVAHDRAFIDGGVNPVDPGQTPCRICCITCQHDHRHAVAPGVVNRHRRMLQADHAVNHARHGFARHLGVAMRHAYRPFLMAAHDHFRRLVAAIVDDGFLQAAQCRGGHHRHILDARAAHHIDHEVRTRIPNMPLRNLIGMRTHGFSGDRSRRWLHRRCGCWFAVVRCTDDGSGAGGTRYAGRTRGQCAFEEDSSARTACLGFLSIDCFHLLYRMDSDTPVPRTCSAGPQALEPEIDAKGDAVRPGRADGFETG